MAKSSWGTRAWAALAVVAWSGVVLQLGLSIALAQSNGRTAVDGVVAFLGYFTVLSNLFVALVATLPLLAGDRSAGRAAGSALVAGCATTAILTVGIGYHLLLRHVWAPQGLQWVADVILHYAVPLATLACWTVWPPATRFDLRLPLLWCLYPIGYGVYAVVRGAVLGSYPYPFIDVAVLGYRQVLLNMLGLLVCFLVLGVVVLAMAAWRTRARLRTAQDSGG